MGSRRLAAIMFTDIVGYTSLAQKNEKETMELLAEHERILRPIFQNFNGRVVKTIGDAFLVEFASALEAVQCADSIQKRFRERNGQVTQDKKIVLRVGVHVGEVIVNDDGGHSARREVRVIKRGHPTDVLLRGECLVDEALPGARREEHHGVAKVDHADAPAVVETPAVPNRGGHRHLSAGGDKKLGR